MSEDVENESDAQFRTGMRADLLRGAPIEVEINGRALTFAQGAEGGDLAYAAIRAALALFLQGADVREELDANRKLLRSANTRLRHNGLAAV